MARRVRRLYRELDKRQISFRPHVWLSEEWFSPDGVPGIAVPFYLAHPRLERLERRMMRNVEGGSAESAMRILRHEAGHAIDTAYRLRRRKRWREVFGPASLPYPGYLPRASRQPPLRAASRRVVRAVASLRGFRRDLRRVAQAEFLVAPHLRAVARVPQARVRRRVAGAACVTTRPPVRNREVVEPLRENTRTLADHYRRKLRRYSMYRRTVTDHLLERVFTAERSRARARRASTFLRANSLRAGERHDA